MKLDDRRYPPTRFARFVVDGDDAAIEVSISEVL